MPVTIDKILGKPLLHKHKVGDVVATGTPSDTTFLRGDGAWQTPDTGTPVTDATIETTDITTNDVSTSKHGWFPKLPSPTGKYLKDNLTWDTPAGGSVDFNVDGGLSNSTYDQVAAIDGGAS